MRSPVSIVTVTKDRRSFVPHLRQSIEALEYDQSLIEWVVVDDGRQPIFDLVRDFKNLRYMYSDRHLRLGRKRNLANSLVTGEFVFNFDDDNYAFPSRIRTAIDFFAENPDIPIVGSSEMFVLDTHLRKVYTTGPFARNHATLGTWAFRASLLKETQFSDEDAAQEEQEFTKGWTLPLGQLSKWHTSVCVDHGRNTVSKQHLLADAKEFLEIEAVVRSEFSRTFFRQLRAAT
jgi:glycosyltransferase involved in cell wall biosynthesis